jgi:molybdopterin converting factor small subunit
MSRTFENFNLSQGKEELFKKMNDECLRNEFGQGWIKLNIDEIDNIKVLVLIYMTDKSISLDFETVEIVKHSQLVIFPRKILFSSFLRKKNGNQPITADEIKTAIDKLYEHLSKMKFDKFENNFITETCELNVNERGVKENEKLDETKRKYPNFKPCYFEECSICLEMTKGKTPCKHPLCFGCWQDIKRPNEFNFEPTVYKFEIKYGPLKPCPICRKPFENEELHY